MPLPSTTDTTTFTAWLKLTMNYIMKITKKSA